MTAPTSCAAARRQAGFSLIELMISITISLIIMTALAAMFLNVSNANNEMAKSNSQIENGRFAIQLLESDLVHAGFWGGYVPEFDDLTWSGVPQDVPGAIPDPCLAFASWTDAYRDQLLGIPVQTGDAAPGTCVLSNKKSSTDVLVVRHAATCVPGETNCDADTAGKLYFQASQCAPGTAGTVQAVGNAALTVALSPSTTTPSTSTVDNAYSGMTIRITGGTGAGQSRVISSYSAATAIATVAAAWTVTPNATSTYLISEGLLATSGFTLRARAPDCSAAAAAPKRKFVSNIYYIRDYADTVGDGIPTLVRASFDPTGPAALSHQSPVALVEGIEGFSVELGFDTLVARCALGSAVDYSQAIARVNPSTCAADTDATLNSLPSNRGDGNPDSFVHCTTASACSAAQLSNAVAARLLVLVRTSEPTSTYTDTKTYCMVTLPANGVCPTADTRGPFKDHYKRHLFTTTVRLTTISGRRETP